MVDLSSSTSVNTYFLKPVDVVEPLFSGSWLSSMMAACWGSLASGKLNLRRAEDLGGGQDKTVTNIVMIL